MASVTALVRAAQPDPAPSLASARSGGLTSGIAVSGIDRSATSVSGIDGWWAVGFAGVAMIGLGLLRRTVRARIRWIVLAATVSALVGLWYAPLVYAANGAFVAAMALISGGSYVVQALRNADLEQMV